MNAITAKDGFFGPRLHKCVVLILFVAAFAVRLYRIDEAPRDFWTIRQYYNAQSARALFLRTAEGVPPWRLEVAQAHRVWLAEPPILEYVVSRIYKITGPDQFWVFRTFTISAWLMGGVFLYLLGIRMMGRNGALTTAAFYLFLPFGITASRSWQPDPLMVMGVAASAFFIYRYFENPCVRRLVAAGLAAAAATVIKPGGSVLTILGMFGFLSLFVFGWKRTLIPGPSWFFAGLMLIPPAMLVVGAAAAGWYEPVSHLHTYLAPKLLATVFFWKGWAGILIRILTLPGLLLAVLGAAFLLAGRERMLAAGFAAGYFVFALICAFVTPNHDYWHLQVIPLAALGIGAASVPLWQGLQAATKGPPAKVIVLLMGTAWLLLSVERAPWIRDRGSDIQSYALMAGEIGEAVGHSTRVIILDYDFGTPLRYYAEINGPQWPQTEAMLYDHATGKDRGPEGEPLWNTLDLSAEERFELFYKKDKPEYFVVSRLIKELDLQPGLRDFLYNRHPVVRQGVRYVVFDLRNASIETTP